MASRKELKALITLAGKVDPSLQASLLSAAKQTKGLSQNFGLLNLAGQKMKTTVSGFAGEIGKKMPQSVQNMAKMASQNKLVQASFTTLGKVGKGSLSALKVGGKMALAGVTALAVAGTAALVGVAKTGLQTASDLTEVQNVVDVTFGDNAKTVDAWSQSLLKAYGLSELSAKKYASTTGAMLKSSGISDKNVLAMSQGITQLTGDMASFYNLQPDEMFEKIRSGISGETEPLKALGINMSVANLEAFALSQGINKSYQAMSQAEQMTLRYNYLMSATADAQGDFSRTSDSLSNQTKLMKENFTQLSAKIMQAAIPALSKILAGVNGFMDSMDTQGLGNFVAGIADLALQLLPVAMQLMPAIQSTMEALLPPITQVVKMLLPPLTQFAELIAKSLGVILPPLMQIVSVVLPPIISLFELILKVAGAGISKIGELLSGIAGLFGGNSSGSEPLPQYARGGFSSRPAIFGEAGLEAAIPIKRGSQRSISLLERTAQLLGLRRKGDDDAFSGLRQRLPGMAVGYRFVYAPVINGGTSQQVVAELRRQYESFREMYENWMNRERRLAW